jgi:leucyl-tRNA synthetase
MKNWKILPDESLKPGEVSCEMDGVGIHFSPELAIQINGKVRGEIIVDSNEQDEAVKERAMNLEITKKWLEGRPVKKVIYVKNRLVNIVG